MDGMTLTVRADQEVYRPGATVTLVYEVCNTLDVPLYHRSPQSTDPLFASVQLVDDDAIQGEHHFSRPKPMHGDVEYHRFTMAPHECRTYPFTWDQILPGGPGTSRPDAEPGRVTGWYVGYGWWEGWWTTDPEDPVVPPSDTLHAFSAAFLLE